MVDKEITTPVTEPTEWVSSLTYPSKSDETICPYLHPNDLNKAIIREHYKAPTLEKISHRLSGTIVFSKHDAKGGFWSIHLRHTCILSHYLQHTQGTPSVPPHAIWTKDFPACLPNVHGSNY